MVMVDFPFLNANPSQLRLLPTWKGVSEFRNDGNISGTDSIKIAQCGHEVANNGF